MLISYLEPILLRRLSEKCVTKGSKYVHLIGVYLSFYLSWVLGPSVHGRLENQKTSEDTFGHDITPLNKGLRLGRFTKMLAQCSRRSDQPLISLLTASNGRKSRRVRVNFSGGAQARQGKLQWR